MTSMQDLLKPAMDKAIALKHELGPIEQDNHLIRAVCKKCNQSASYDARTKLSLGGATYVECGKAPSHHPIQPQNNNLNKETEDMATEAKKKAVSVKDRLRKLFNNKKRKFTMDEIVKELKAKAVTIKTAICDLKNKKYAGKDGVFVLEMDDKKRYHRASN